MERSLTKVGVGILLPLLLSGCDSHFYVPQYYYPQTGTMGIIKTDIDSGWVVTKYNNIYYNRYYPRAYNYRFNYSYPRGYRRTYYDAYPGFYFNRGYTPQDYYYNPGFYSQTYYYRGSF